MNATLCITIGYEIRSNTGENCEKAFPKYGIPGPGNRDDGVEVGPKGWGGRNDGPTRFASECRCFGNLFLKPQANQ